MVMDNRDDVISALIDSNRQREEMINSLIDEIIDRGVENSVLKRYIGILERRMRVKTNGLEVDSRKNIIDRVGIE